MEIGIILGIIVGVCLTVGITITLVIKSNDIGDCKAGRFQHGSAKGAFYYEKKNKYGDTYFHKNAGVVTDNPTEDLEKMMKYGAYSEFLRSIK